MLQIVSADLCNIHVDYVMKYFYLIPVFNLKR